MHFIWNLSISHKNHFPPYLNLPRDIEKYECKYVTPLFLFLSLYEYVKVIGGIGYL